MVYNPTPNLISEAEGPATPTRSSLPQAVVLGDWKDLKQVIDRYGVKVIFYQQHLNGHLEGYYAYFVVVQGAFIICSDKAKPELMLRTLNLTGVDMVHGWSALVMEADTKSIF